MTTSEILSPRQRDALEWFVRGMEAADKKDFQCPTSFWDGNGESRKAWSDGLRWRFSEIDDWDSKYRADYLYLRAKNYCSLPLKWRIVISWIAYQIQRLGANEELDMNTESGIRKFFLFIDNQIGRLPSPLKEITNGAYVCVFMAVALTVILALAVFVTASIGVTLKLVGITTPLVIPPHDGTPFINLMLVGATYLLVLSSVIAFFFVIGSASSENKNERH